MSPTVRVCITMSPTVRVCVAMSPTVWVYVARYSQTVAMSTTIRVHVARYNHTLLLCTLQSEYLLLCPQRSECCYVPYSQTLLLGLYSQMICYIYPTVRVSVAMSPAVRVSAKWLKCKCKCTMAHTVRSSVAMYIQSLCCYVHLDYVALSPTVTICCYVPYSLTSPTLRMSPALRSPWTWWSRNPS
jgi:hypothetical protein